MVLKIYDRFANWICNFETDKYIHFTMGFFIAFMSFMFSYRVFTEKIIICSTIGLTIGFVIGLGKEYIDKMRGEVFDIKDAISTWVGSASGLILGLLAYVCLV